MNIKQIPLLLAVWVVSFAGWASFPDTPPHDVTKQVTFQQIDRSALPSGQYNIFEKEIAATGPSLTTDYDRAGFICRSSTDSTTGACPSSLVWSLTYDPTLIKLRFKEKRSHVAIDLTLSGQKGVLWSNQACASGGYGTLTSLQIASAIGCNGSDKVGSALNLWFDQSELQKLPVGGIWTATLVLDFQHWDPYYRLSTYTVNFLVDMTDKANIQVWLPEFGKGNPLVDLNLRPKISGGSLVNDSGYSGKNVIDMCLYDGYSTNSSTMQLQFSSAEGGSGTNNFILKDSANHELPYQVNFAFNGQDTGKSIINGEQWNITNASQLPINWNRILPVSLPDLSIPVLCWPAKMTLSADLPSSQSAGQYQGILKMVFTPSTTAI